MGPLEKDISQTITVGPISTPPCSSPFLETVLTPEPLPSPPLFETRLEPIAKDEIAIIFLAGGRGERLTTPQAVASEGHVCPKPLCALPSGFSLLDTLTFNGSFLSTKMFASTNIPDKNKISPAQSFLTNKIRDKIQMKSKTLGIGFSENNGLGSAYAAYGENIQNAIKKDPEIKYIFLVPGDTPLVTRPDFLREVLLHHMSQEKKWVALNKRPGVTIVSTDHLDPATGRETPTVKSNMGCMARNKDGDFLGMVEAPFLQTDPSPIRFPIGQNSTGALVYISPNQDPQEDPHEFARRIQNSSEVCAGVLLFSRDAYESLDAQTFFEKKGERDAFSGPIVGLLENNFGISAFNVHRQWLLEGVNTRSQLRTLTLSISQGIKSALSERGVNVSDLKYISLSNGFLIEDIEAGATFKGTIFLSGRVHICAQAVLSNATIRGCKDSKRLIKIGRASLENSYVSASSIDRATIVASAIFSTDITSQSIIKNKEFILGKCKRLPSPSDTSLQIYKTWIQTKKRLREEHLLILEQIYCVTILPNTKIFVSDDILDFFEALLSTINTTCAGKTLEQKIDFFLRNPSSPFAQRLENGFPAYTTRDIPFLLDQRYKKFEFFIGANTVLGGLIGITGSDTRIGSDVFLTNTLVNHSSISPSTSYSGRYIEKNNPHIQLTSHSFASLHAVPNLIPYMEPGRKLEPLAEFFELVKKLPLLEDNLEDILVLIKRWLAHDFRDYAEVLSDADIASIVREDYRPGICSFEDYCAERNVSPLQLLEDIIDQRICISSTEHQSHILALKKAAKYLLEITDLKTITEQQIISELWKMARLLYKTHNSVFYNPYAEISRTLHAHLDQIITLFANTLDSIPPSHLLAMLAIANNFEMSFGDNFEEKVLGTESKLKNLDKISLSIDGRDLFIKHVYNRPQKLAIFVDNLGEILFDLLYVLAQARMYKKSDPKHTSDWKIAIIPRAQPIHIDASYSAVMNCIFNDPRFTELQSLLMEKKLIVFRRGPHMQGINIRTLSREVVEYLDLLKEEHGTVLSIGMGNSETIEGITINHFSIFTVKSFRMETLSGASKGSYAMAYIPQRYKPRICSAVGHETLLGITAWEQAKDRLIEQGISISSENNLLSAEAMWLYTLPLLAVLERQKKPILPFFLERGAFILQCPWEETIKALTPLGKSLSTHFISKKITGLDKASDPHYFASLINSFLTEKELLDPITEKECTNMQAAFFLFDPQEQEKISAALKAFGKTEFSDLLAMSRGECIDLFANIGIDARWKMAYIRKRFTEKHWRPSEEDRMELRLVNYECYKQFMDFWEIRDIIIQREGETVLRDLFDRVVIFQNTVIATATMYRNTSHTARPFLNILLKDTQFANTLHTKKLFFIDESLAMGRTAVTCELLLRSFYADADWDFSSIVSEDGYAAIGTAFSSPGPERPPENRPELVPILNAEVQYLPGTKIPVYKTYYLSEALSELEQLFAKETLPETELSQLLEEHNNNIEKLVKDLKNDILSGMQQERLGTLESTEEVQIAEAKETEDFFGTNILYFISIVKMHLRGSQKNSITYTYVNDFLAPPPWEGNKMNKLQIAKTALLECLKKLTSTKNALYTSLHEKDALIRVFEEIKLARGWQDSYKAYSERQKKSVQILVADKTLQDLVKEYFAHGIRLKMKADC